MDTPPGRAVRFREEADSQDDTTEDDATEMVNQGLSAAVTPALQKKATKEQIQSGKRFVVRTEMLNDIFMRVKVRADIDAFNTGHGDKTKVFQQFWGKRVWSTPWGPDAGVLWLNPSVNDIYDTIRRVRRDKSRAVLVVPDWEDELWYEMLWPMVVEYYYYRPRVPLYEHEHPPWGSWAVYCEGHRTMSGVQMDDRASCRDEGLMQVSAMKVKKTPSSRRKWRRMTLKQHRNTNFKDSQSDW